MEGETCFLHEPSRLRLRGISVSRERVEPLPNHIKLLLEHFCLALQHATLDIAGRCDGSDLHSPTESHPAGQARSAIPVPPTATASTAPKPTAPETSSRNRIRVSQPCRTRAITHSASRHWTRTQRACSISTWHVIPPFCSSLKDCLTYSFQVRGPCLACAQGRHPGLVRHQVPGLFHDLVDFRRRKVHDLCRFRIPCPLGLFHLCLACYASFCCGFHPPSIYSSQRASP